MDYLAILSGIMRTERDKAIKASLSRVNLVNKKDCKVKELSGGMKQRLGIAQAIVHNPSIIIVDEPTVGLDPEERVRFRSLLHELALDRTVVLSTHIVEDIEKSCESMAIIHEGQILYNGRLKTFIKSHNSLEEAYISLMGETQ